MNVVAKETLDEKVPGRNKDGTKELDLGCSLGDTKVQENLRGHRSMSAQVLGLDLGVGNHLADISHA